MANVDKRLNNIQASLDSFNKTNLTLIEKVQELSKLNDRVKVLEESLGSTDKLVVQLKVTLEKIQQSIDEQGVITNNLTAGQFEENLREVESKKQFFDFISGGIKSPKMAEKLNQKGWSRAGMLSVFSFLTGFANIASNVPGW